MEIPVLNKIVVATLTSVMHGKITVTMAATCTKLIGSLHLWSTFCNIQWTESLKLILDRVIA